MIPITIQSQDKAFWTGSNIRPSYSEKNIGIYCGNQLVATYENIGQRDFVLEQIAQAIDKRKPLYRMPSPEEAEKLIHETLNQKPPEEAQPEEAGMVNPVFKKPLTSIATPSKEAEPAITYAEQTWGRPLSGPECESISKNIDGFTALGCQDPNNIIIEAIKRADLQGIRTMRYIDSMLREWQKKKLITIAEVEADDERFQKAKNKNKAKICEPGKYDDIYL